MNKKIVFFFLIIPISLFVFSNVDKVERGGEGEYTIFSNYSVLRMLEINGFQIEILGIWDGKPGLLKQIFPSKKDWDFNIMIEFGKVTNFSSRELEATVEEIKGELKNLYLNGGKIKVIKIKDKKSSRD